MATAAEMYASTNSAYPTSEALLIGATPPYLNRSYCETASYGFTFTCAWGSGAYTLVATPVVLGATGTATYTITTGGVLTP